VRFCITAVNKIIGVCPDLLDKAQFSIGAIASSLKARQRFRTLPIELRPKSRMVTVISITIHMSQYGDIYASEAEWNKKYVFCCTM